MSTPTTPAQARVLLEQIKNGLEVLRTIDDFRSAEVKRMSASVYVRSQPMKTWRNLAKNDPNPYVREAATKKLNNLPWWFCCTCCF
jgi:hypothetical protein